MSKIGKPLLPIIATLLQSIGLDIPTKHCMVDLTFFNWSSHILGFASPGHPSSILKWWLVAKWARLEAMLVANVTFGFLQHKYQVPLKKTAEW